MMKRLLIMMTLATALAAGDAAGAQEARIDAGSRARLRAMQAPARFERAAGGHGRLKVSSRADGEQAEPTVNAFITLRPGMTAAAIEELGLETHLTRTGMVLASFPLSMLDAVKALECVESIRTERPTALKLDKVRAATGVDKIHRGEELPRAYTGKGVVCGIVDGGFDPNHVNFVGEDGKSRIKQFTYFRGTEAGPLVPEYWLSDDIPDIDTENDKSFHATHTTGIMAGSYRGKVKVCEGDYYRTEEKEIDNPYYGIAYDADICTASAYQGQLSDYYIALGVESVLNYATYCGQPAVINLSLGSNVGPHDGSSAICRYLDEVIEDDQVNTLVCISAGNEGDMPIAITHTMQSDGETVGTCLYAMYNGMIEGVQNPRAGLVYIYSDTAEPFEVQGVIVNTSRGVPAFRMGVDSNPEGTYKYWVSSTDWMQDASDIVSTSFAQYLTGYMGINAETDPDSGRYYAVLDFMTYDNTLGKNSGGSYVLGFIVTGKKGQRIDIYGDGGYCNFTSYGMADYVNGGFDGTINDIACGREPIIVGSYNTRETWISLDGVTYGYGSGVIPLGEMSAYTSYGTLIDGRTLPDICAPGATVISSSNEYYLDAEKINDDSNVQARCTDGTRKYSWHQCIGTSMAAPAVAGTLALWLEADPTLTCAKAKEILRETAVRDSWVTGSGVASQWGAGKMDAYAGLKRVLEQKDAGVDNVLADPDRRPLARHRGGGTYEVYLAGAESVEARVYNMQGACVKSATAPGCEATVECGTLAPGVYILTVNGNHSQKITIRP